MNIVFLACTHNYRHSFSASNYKMEMLAKGLTSNKHQCTLHNGIDGVVGINEKEDYFLDGVGRVISYPRTGSRYLNHVKNITLVYSDLKQIYVQGEKNILILLTPLYHVYLMYILMGKRIGYNICTISHEWLTTFNGHSFLRKMSEKIYAKMFGYGIDYILPISEYIIERIKHFNKPYLKTPILADFQIAPAKNSTISGFTYCATIDYRRIIDMIVESFAVFSKQASIKYPLNLVVSGNDAKIDNLKKYLKKNYPDLAVNVYSKLPYDELFSLYKSSLALLLPLNPLNEQDKARFSQKVAEYLSTGTPIISTKVGEMPIYFTDRENIIFSEYSIEEFSKTYHWITNNIEKSIEIGIKGFELGRREFDVYQFGCKLSKFLDN